MIPAPMFTYARRERSACRPSGVELEKCIANERMRLVAGKLWYPLGKSKPRHPTRTCNQCMDMRCIGAPGAMRRMLDQQRGHLERVDDVALDEVTGYLPRNVQSLSFKSESRVG